MRFYVGLIACAAVFVCVSFFVVVAQRNELRTKLDNSIYHSRVLQAKVLEEETRLRLLRQEVYLYYSVIRELERKH